ncbi:SGNH/GDSL hydrolase family protein [Altererythrobacter fulvus]|uniref:SGNH/GDSL hydrolase family protein n=1 Tax=Caenibius fulvus TaxID=2126012 RepID=UPI00301B5697
MIAVDAISRGRARQQGIASRRRRLADSLRATMGRYEVPRFVPCVVAGIAQRATATAYAYGALVAQDAWVLRCIKAGASGASAMLSLADPDYIADGAAVWAVQGRLAPVPFANNLAMAKGQQFATGGMMFEVTVAGTTHAADAAPSAPSGGTHGSVTYVYVGRQELPLVYLVEGAAPAGTSQQAACSDNAKIAARGGVKVDAYPNNGTVGTIMSQSWDGAALARGQGSWLWQTDAPLAAIRGFMQLFGDHIWVDGRIVANVTQTAAAAYRQIVIDSTGLSRRMRTIRHRSGSVTGILGIWATGFDTVRAWSGYSPLRIVSLGDSFTEGYGFTSYLSDMLGVEDWWVQGMGDTGILDTGPGRANWTERLTLDVISRDPDIVLIPLSQNDGPGEATNIAFAAMLDRIRNETHAEVVVVGVWNNRGPLTSGNAYALDTDLQAICAAKGVPYIKWRDLLTDGGYVGAAAGTGNSKFYTTYDGTHPTAPAGMHFRASYLAPRFLEAVEGLAA